MMRESFSSLDGGLLVDKPKGLTSHDVVAAVRRKFKVKKVGHCGTLDPNATGLLILVLGKATKLSERLMGEDKTYEGSIKLGETTDSYDADGEIVKSCPAPPLTLDDLNRETQSFHGDQMQTPPMVSAIKKDGVPLYKLARKGIEVERKPRFIHIYSFKILDYQEPVATFQAACTKGAYVRSLAHDFGEKIGCGAHLLELRRTRIGGFSIEDASPLDAILNNPQSFLESKIIPYLKLLPQ